MAALDAAAQSRTDDVEAAEVAVVDATVGTVVSIASPDTTTVTMLHCLLAITFVAIAMGLLALGKGPQDMGRDLGYSDDAMWQDLRSLTSFVLGTLFYSACFCGNQNTPATAPVPQEPGGKIQLYAYMF